MADRENKPPPQKFWRSTSHSQVKKKGNDHEGFGSPTQNKEVGELIRKRKYDNNAKRQATYGKIVFRWRLGGSKRDRKRGTRGNQRCCDERVVAGDLPGSFEGLWKDGRISIRIGKKGGNGRKSSGFK